MIERRITAGILAALADTPVVLLGGARQTGKSTLAQWIAIHRHPARYLTMDDPAVRATAARDAVGFLTGLDGPVVLDEVQLVPEMFRAIKLVVDRDRKPGKFLLTGSANVMVLPRLSDTLAGRMEILTLWPFSCGELAGTSGCLVDLLFESVIRTDGVVVEDRASLVASLLSGGYPEAVERTDAARRKAWFDAYLTTMIARDVRDLAEIEGRTELPRLLELLASQAMSLLNVAALSREIGIAHTTLKRYLALLEATFMVQPLPAWSGGVRRRLIRAPKIMINDTGLMAYLLKIDLGRLEHNSPAYGQLLENFVAQELCKQIGWSRLRPRLYYYRTSNGREVDFVLEGPGRKLVGIEVKATASPGQQDFKGLEDLAQATGERFHRGVLLYQGRECVPFGPSLHALPISSLWRL